MSMPQPMAEYMSGAGLAGVETLPGGQLSLLFDGRYRVKMLPLPGGAVALESRVAPLPEAAAERERVLAKALRVSCARMRARRDAIALDAARRSLVLQSRLAEGASRLELEALLEAHVNALAFWRKEIA